MFNAGSVFGVGNVKLFSPTTMHRLVTIREESAEEVFVYLVGSGFVSHRRRKAIPESTAKSANDCLRSVASGSSANSGSNCIGD